MERGVVQGRIRKNNRGIDRYVDGATLLQPVTGASALARRVDIPLEKLSPQNVREARTLCLLRARARQLRSIYVRAWRAVENAKVVPFKFECDEGDGSDETKVTKVRKFIMDHKARIDVLMDQIRRSALATTRWTKANKGSGRLKKLIAAREVAVERELSLRLDEPDNFDYVQDGANAPTPPVKSGVPVVLYPAQYAVDVARIEREMEQEEAGVKKPTKLQRLNAERIKAFDVGNLERVQAIDKQVAGKQANRRAARHRKKARKAELKKTLQEYADGKRSIDPPSDNEH